MTHVKLPILAGHVLMGTDAPELVRVTRTFGNASHINPEPIRECPAPVAYFGATQLLRRGQSTLRRCGCGTGKSCRGSRKPPGLSPDPAEAGAAFRVDVSHDMTN
ncbi:MAG: hypothetical protein WCP28_10700 [Actinomycetes bacterium]